MMNSTASMVHRGKTLMASSRRICFVSLLSRSYPQTNVHRPQICSAFSSSSATDRDSLSSFRSQLLETALTKTVPTYGWTDEAIVYAAAELQQQSSSLAAAGLITVSELVAYTMDRSNAALQKELETKEWSADDGDDSFSTTVPLTTKLTWALQRRLELQDDLIRAHRWHEGMAIGAQPQNVMRTKEQLASMIDSIANAYDPSLSTTERLGLGAVYVAAELHMLTDTPSSTDETTKYQATRDFLQQRVMEWDTVRRLNVMGFVPNSDFLWTATQVGSAFLSGAQSLMTTDSYSTATTDGTSPSDYGRPIDHPTKIV